MIIYFIFQLKCQQEAAITFTDLELVVGIYKLLFLDFKNYSQRWKLDNLTRWLTSSVEKNDETSLVKWTTLEILALVFSLTPRQKEKFFRLYFSASDYDDLVFK